MTQHQAKVNRWPRSNLRAVPIGLTVACQALLSFAIPSVFAADVVPQGGRIASNRIEMVSIPGGTFVLGSPSTESDRSDDEGPQRQVQVAAFEISKTPVTRGQFAAFALEIGLAGSSCYRASAIGVTWEESTSLSWKDPGFPQNDSHPVVCVNWEEARLFVDWLNKHDATGRQGWRLPTEAEYEYAARGGTTSARYWNAADPPCRHANVADGSAHLEAKRVMNPFTRLLLEQRGWFLDCDDGFAYTSPVQSFAPNAFGLHDMLGNVWQWVSDCYGKAATQGEAATRSTPDTCALRVARGGSYADRYRAIRCASRGKDNPLHRNVNMGFRVARSAGP